MSSNSTEIYTGVWINWSRGRVLGSTLTLTARDGTVLVSFITFFFTIVGTQLWRALSFILHQSRVSPAPRDGLFHQQQVVLRNSSTPAGAAWLFLQQGWYWKGRAKHHLLRSIPWLILSLLYIALFAFLSIYGASAILKAAGDDRILVAHECGYLTVKDGEAGFNRLNARRRETIATANIYREQCYEGEPDPIACNLYAKPKLEWNETVEDCPFAGDDLCYKDNVLRLDTGWLDSNKDLGINTPYEDGLKYRRTTTCAVLLDGKYMNDTHFPDWLTWTYGETPNQDYTFNLTQHAKLGRDFYTTE